MSWQSVGTHTFVPTDKAVQVGSFDLAAGQDTIWVKITQLNDPGDWPWSYGILSWRNANGAPLGSIKAYSNRFGEVFRLGNGLPPSDGVGSIWFEPRGFNLGWLKAGFPWELQFEAQSGTSGGGGVSTLWFRDPVNAFLSPTTAGDDVVLSSGDLSASGGTFTSNVYIHKTATDPVDVHGIRFIDGTFNSLYTNDVASGGGTQIAYQHNLAGSATYQILGNGEVRIGGNPSTTPKIRLNTDGSAVFAGHVTATNITFRSSDPALMRSGTYVGPELDLLEEIVRLEALVRELYDKLRMTPPSGWDVWDGNTDVVNSRGKKNGHI